MKVLLIVITLVTFVSPCFAARIGIMTYNVENLFDTFDDPKKKDNTFLPKTLKANVKHKKECKRISKRSWRELCLDLDWSPKALKKKMSNLAEVVLSVNSGLGPDILVLQEVENLKVLEKWNAEYLKSAKYTTIAFIEGHDIRGIDVAFLSRLPLKKSPILHSIPFKDERKRVRDDTRGILEAEFSLPDGTTLTGYANHFPAPFHPHKMRVEAYKFLNGLIKSKKKKSYYFAAGDFNTPKSEDRKQKMLDKHVRKKWLIAHEECSVGCAKGSHYYHPKKEWSFLDMILLSKSFKKKGPWKWMPKSTRTLHKLKVVQTKYKTPKSYQWPGDQSGASDHLALYTEIVTQ